MYDKYPRGAKFWGELSSITQLQMGEILARNSGEWHLLRMMISKIDFQYALRDIQPWKDKEMVACIGNILVEIAEKAQEKGLQSFAHFLEDLTYEIPLVYA